MDPERSASPDSPGLVADAVARNSQRFAAEHAARISGAEANSPSPRPERRESLAAGSGIAGNLREMSSERVGKENESGKSSWFRSPIGSK